MSEAPSAPKKGRKIVLPERFVPYRGVAVFIEQERGTPHPVSWELLGEGRKLADALGVELSAIVMGAPGAATRGLCQEAFAYGADIAYLAEHPVLADYRNEPYTQALTRIVEQYQPEILMLGATTLGRDLAGSVATTLATGLTADCTELAIDPDTRALAATRPTFGGSLLCTIQTLAVRPQMATVRPRVMPMPEPQAGRGGRVVEVALTLVEGNIITRVLDYIPDDLSGKPQLAWADIIVSGGKGLKRAENFRLVWDLARVLGAEVGATRPVVQAGWAELDRQVGQSGKTVRPRLYIAAGISGAVQHRVGMEGSDLIVAINSDPNAPIFDFAHHAIVGDAMKLLPALTAAFQARLGERTAA